DGVADLFLFKDTGESAIRLMDENARLGPEASLQNNGPTWHAKALADFDQAGQGSDIVWQNDNGAVAVWQMDGTVNVSGANLGNPGAGVRVVAADDFDGSGAADILLQDGSGQLTLWLMDDSAHIRQGGELTIGQNPGAPWHVAATGDFNHDGQAGILF